ncbi:MAG: hypothetical protein AAF492_10400 [Verrucomicrobiota bacterium]
MKHLFTFILVLAGGVVSAQQFEIEDTSHEDAMAFFRKHLPDVVPLLERAEQNPTIESNKWDLIQIREDATYYKNLNAADPEIAAAFLKRVSHSFKSRALIKKIKKETDPAKRTSLKQELRESQAVIFEVNILERKHQLKWFEHEVRVIRNIIAERERLKEDLLDKRVLELITDSDVLKWNW